MKKIKQLAYTLTSLSMVLLPAVVYGQSSIADGGTGGEFADFLNNVIGFINSVLVPLIFAVALALFIYGVFLYFIQSGESEDGRKKGGSYVLWSVIAFVIMVSVWGITNLIAGGLGLNQADSVETPVSPTRTTK